MRVFIVDSTLRAGALSHDVSFRMEDRYAIVQKLDEFGIDVIEACAPTCCDDCRQFFERAAALPLQHARLAAFGSADPLSVEALLEYGTPVITLLGETWDARVYRDLMITEEENLRRIRTSVSLVKTKGRDVIYDAAHFFDAYESAPEFAMRTLEAAIQGGADVITLCDTNGGSLPSRLAEICAAVRRQFPGQLLGIQARNDSELAVANTFTAVQEGFNWVQGTFNGYGPRCGWANLCSVLPGLELKLGHSAVWRKNLEQITALAHFIAGAACCPLPPHRPYVGRAAFDGLGYQDEIPWHHTRPEYVGNRRVALVSDLLSLAREYSKAPLDESVQRELHDRVAQLEAEGYDIQDASGTFELLAREAANPGLRPFEVIHYEVTTRQPCAVSPANSEASVTLLVGDAVLLSQTAQGDGPVHALDLALRRCLGPQFPALEGARLIDYRVHVLDHDKGTAARVAVFVEWANGTQTWNTMGIARNVIEASWRALADGLRLELMRLAQQDHSAVVPAEDYSWAV